MILGHCHVDLPGNFRKMWDRMGEEDGTFPHLDRFLGELGYERAVVFAPFRRWFDGDPNAWLMDAVRGNDRYVPWVTLQDAGPSAAEMVRRYASLGARGVKFHPAIIEVGIDDPALEGFWAGAEEAGLPVLIHAGPHGWFLEKYRPVCVDGVARRHPKLRIIVEHLGGAGLARETYAVMQNSPNVYGGLTTCLNEEATWHVPAEELGFMLRKLGADRFVYGSDFPWNGTDACRKDVEVLRGLGLSPADLSLVVSGNIERLVSRPA